MTRALAVGLAVLVCCATAAGQVPSAPVGAHEWVAYSADIRITFASGKEAWGRRLQDEHGCVRDEMVHPDGSALITLINFQTQQTYRLYHGSWTSQPMRMGQLPHAPLQLRVTRKADPIEGFDAYVHEANVRSPKGDYLETTTVIPALNFFRAVVTTPTGERRVAANIKVAPQPHEEFLPPPGALVTEQPGFGGFMSFSAVVLRLSFAGQAPFEAVTTEESAYAVKTPSGIALTLVTSVIDQVKHVVRIRVLANATGRPGDVRGDLLDEVTVPLGSTGSTTKLGETLTIAVTRVATATK
jgi:hypothetical protein